MADLIISNKKYPKQFENHETIVPVGETIQNYFESLLIRALNNKNNKLKINKVEYANLKDEFNLPSMMFSGIIQEENKILGYVFMSPGSGRNILVGQTLFPDLVDNMKTYIDSPSFTLTNHPIYFINSIDKNEITKSVKRDFALLSAAGIHYVELFQHEIIDVPNVPNNITEFNNYMNNLNLEPIYFHLDIPERKLIIQSTIDILTEDKSSFDGSNEKFFFREILFSSILASKSGFQIDFSDFESFIDDFKDSIVSIKMERCVTLLEYLKKLQLKKNYKYEL